MFNFSPVAKLEVQWTKAGSAKFLDLQIKGTDLR